MLVGTTCFAEAMRLGRPQNSPGRSFVGYVTRPAASRGSSMCVAWRATTRSYSSALQLRRPGQRLCIVACLRLWDLCRCFAELVCGRMGVLRRAGPSLAGCVFSPWTRAASVVPSEVAGCFALLEQRPPSAPEGAATQRHRHMTVIASSRLAAVPMSSNENGPAPRHCSDHRVWSCPAILSARPHARRPVSELIVGRVTFHGWVGGSRVQKARPGNRRREVELMHSRVSSVLRVLSLSSVR